jgi:perosamine synthetase
MLTAISRYGARVLPNTVETIAACRARGELIRGPDIAEFEKAFAARLGTGQAITASHGRMAFYYILKALALPPGSEIIFPALTFWVVPELARVAGLKVVFADIDPRTFTLDPESFERAITTNTRAVVPTHLFGLTCDMESIGAIARRHNLAVVEDCAHALGATYRGQPAGTFGVAGFFSFQTLKPLNTYGGGMALVHDPDLAARVATLAASEPWPDEKRVNKRLFLGRIQRIFIRPQVFTWTLFPILWTSSWTKSTSDPYLWEPVRPLSPLPDGYAERYSNVQARLGLEGLKHLDEWTCLTQAHAQAMNKALAGLPGVEVPLAPPGRTHVYYQYCLYVPDRDRLVKDCIRHGVDLEMRHVDVCNQLPLFKASHVVAPGAERTADAVQVPVYAGLTDEEVERVARVVRRYAARPGAAATEAVSRL